MIQDKTIFVSYAASDSEWAAGLAAHLSPALRSRNVCMHTAADVPAGTDRLYQLRTMIEAATIVIILISTDYFNDPGIQQTELPLILERKSSTRSRTTGLLLRPCLWDCAAWIHCLDDWTPSALSGMSPHGAERYLVEFVQRVMNSVTSSSSAHVDIPPGDPVAAVRARPGDDIKVLVAANSPSHGKIADKVLQMIASNRPHISWEALTSDSGFDTSVTPPSLFVFIIARKSPKSIIKAYNWAHKHKIPILAYLTNPFLHDETVSDNFRRRLHERQSLGIFDDTEDLEYQLEVDLRISLGIQDIDAIQPQRTFVWRSSVYSVTAGCVSAIAIAETVLACVLVVLCSLRFATFFHILVGCAIVPVFLLRTSANTEETIRLLSAMLRHLHVAVLRSIFTYAGRLLLVAPANFFVAIMTAFIVKDLLPWFFMPLLLFFFPVFVGIFIVVFAILFGPTHTASFLAMLLLFPLRVRNIITSLFHDFSQTVLAAKANFYRIGFCLDLFHPPELVPGLERYLQKTGFQRKAPSIADADYCYPSDWRFHRSLIRSIVTGHAPAPRGPAGYPTFISIERFLIRAIVRTLLKGTLLIYAPCIWFLADGSLDDLDLDSRMHLICESSIAKVSRAYSAIALIASVFAIGIAPHREILFAGVRLPKVAALAAPELFFTPSFGLTTWRAFVCVGGVLGWATYLVADMAVRRTAVGRPWPAPRLQNFFFICRICRGIIATYVVIGMLYFILRLQYE